MSRRLLAFSMAAALGVGTALVAAVPSGAQSQARPASAQLRSATPPPVPQTAVRVGALAAGTKLRLDVVLKVRNQAALNAYLAGLSNAKSPFYHQFLARGQFGSVFGPTRATVSAVRSALRQQGLSLGATSANRIIIPVSTTAAVAQRAFGVSMSRYRLASGRVAYSYTGTPRLAASVQPYVTGVIGLSSLYQDQRMVVFPPAHAAKRHAAMGRRVLAPDASGPKPCSAAKSTGSNQDGFTANQLAGYYLMSDMYKLGDLGSGVHVAIFELEPNLKSDISTYESCYGVHTSVGYTKVDGGSGSGAGSGEAALDIEDVLGLAPDSSINVYQGPNSNTGVLDTYDAIVNADTDQVVTTSWGECELVAGATMMSSEQEIFAQAATQGQTVFAAAGDTGSTGCLRSGVDDSDVSAGDPASQPDVVGVGGTTITNSGEVVWNESGDELGAGGGAVSGYWCMPSYQYQTKITGLISSLSQTNSGCTNNAGDAVRQEPDVTADADPLGGYVVYYDGTWQVIGGTSAAAPLWAAVAALIDASPFCKDYGSGDAGVRPAGLYDAVAVNNGYVYTDGEVLTDITSGNNDYLPSGYSGGLYPATAGYDMASGLGSPLLAGIDGNSISNFYPGLAAMMCRTYDKKLKTTTITKISPASGPTKGGTKVTIDGSGFLPIAGADMAVIGGKLYAVSCSSSTKCTLKMPKHGAGTVQIQVSAEDFTLSAKTSHDKFKYRS